MKIYHDKNSGQSAGVGAYNEAYMGQGEAYMGAGGYPHRIAATERQPQFIRQPQAVIPRGGGARISPLRPVLQRQVTTPNEFEELGTKQYLRRANNELANALGLLTVNTAAVFSTIFQFQIPVNQTLTFKPQNWQARDANCPSFLLLLFADDTASLPLQGDYRILVFNSDTTRTKEVIGSGVMEEFLITRGTSAVGFTIVQAATLNDVQNKVYYTSDYEAVQGDVIQVQINSETQVLDVDSSELYLGHYRYTP